MSVRGNSPAPCRAAAPRGFTLLELLLVIALIALAGGGVSFALRDRGEHQLEREAQRLAAMLDAARAQSRAAGVPVLWRSDEVGFAFLGLGPGPVEHTPWITPGIVASAESAVLLGPEPIIERQRIELVLGERRVVVGTDGLRPFAVLSGEAVAGAVAQ